MVQFRSTTSIAWLFSVLALSIDDSLAARKVKRIPIGFRYVKDLEASATDHQGGSKHEEEGGGRKHEEDRWMSKGEEGDKGYKIFHKFDKGAKGHYDGENHEQWYDENKGEEKRKHEEVGHYDEHGRDEGGEKAANFDEEGKHQEGYSTKGERSILKKDEYEKKHDFYDEYHEDGEHEKHGGYRHEHEGKKGGHEKKGHLDSGHKQHRNGVEKLHDIGHRLRDRKNHESAEGKDSHRRSEERYGKKGGQESGKKWFATTDR